MLILYLANFLHIKIDDGDLCNCRKDVMKLLREVFGMAQENDDSFFFIDELFDG
jgi:ATP-dependent 26S proteasome regulatory subunit